MLKPNLPENEELRLKELRDFQILDSESETAFDELTKLASEICGTKISVISLIDSDRQWFKSTTGIDAKQTPRDVSWCGHAILKDEIFEVPDSQLDERFKDNPLAVGEPYVRFYAGAPLITHNGYRLGTLCVIDNEPKKLSEWQRVVLRRLANQAMILIEGRSERIKLKEANTRLDAIVNNIPIMLTSFDEKGDFDWVNNQWIRELGWEVDDLAKDKLLAQVLPEKEKESEVLSFMLSPKTKWLDCELKKKGGGTTHSTWTNIKLNNGKFIGIGKNIDDRMHAENELKLNNTRLDLILKGARLGSWDWWLKTNEVTFDHLWCEMLGLNHAETPMNFLTWKDRLHPDDLENALKDVKNHIEGKTDYYENTNRMKHVDGSWVWILARGQVSERDINGSPIRFTGTQLNITNQKKSEQQLRDNQEKVHAIYEGSNDSVMLLTQKGFLDCNKKTLELFKVSSKEEFLKYHPADLSSHYQPDGELSVDKAKRYINIAYEIGFCSFEWVHKKLTGEEFQVEVLLSAFNYQGEKVLQATVRDISARKNLEKLVLDVQKMAKVGGWEFDIDSKELNWTDETYRIHGMEPKKNTDLSIAINCYAPLERPRIQKLVQRGIQDGMPWDDEFEFFDIQGNHKWVRARGEAIKNEAGKVCKLKGTFQDITEKKNLEDNLENEKKISQHQAKLAAIGQLAAGVGHEINNPLAIIKGYLLALEEDLVQNQYTDPQANYMIKKIDTAADRIVKIVNGLRTFSRSDENQLGQFSLKEMIQESLNLFSDIYQKQGLKIHLELKTKNEVLIHGNKGRIEQVIVNLFSNAKDATDGQLERKINIALDEKNGTAILSIQDNGSGIPDSIKERIFEPFFTTKEINKGTGIGLSIASSIIKEHGGDITVESSVNLGTTFTIKLPTTNLQIASFALSQRPPEVQEKKYTLKVLVVDDEDDMREILEKLLTHLGMQVTTAENGKIALEKFHKAEYDLVITDLRMPIMNGVALIESIRSITGTKPPKLILMTGGIDEREFELISSEHLIDARLEKPFNKGLLYKKIRDIFD